MGIKNLDKDIIGFIEKKRFASQVDIVKFLIKKYEIGKKKQKDF